MVSTEFILSLGREALTTVLLVAGPVLSFGLVVGLIVSILQAITQIQEQTLSFIPKIIVILSSIILLGPWMLRVMVDFTTRVISSMPSILR